MEVVGSGDGVVEYSFKIRKRTHRYNVDGWVDENYFSRVEMRGFYFFFLLVCKSSMN